MAASEKIEVAVVGGGLAGLTASIALAEAGVATALIGSRVNTDQRVTALLAGSVTALETLGVWNACKRHAAPLRTIRIVDDTERLIRAPEVSFNASEIGLEAFGYTIENKELMRALEVRAAALPALARFGVDAVAVDSGPQSVTITLKSGQHVSARLAVGADGRHSLCRTSAGIETDSRSYEQTALTFNLRHTRPHNDTSTEFHTESGPFTLVPLHGMRSGLVWVLDPATATDWAARDDAALAEELERRAHSILGRFEVEKERGTFPLAIATARKFGSNRIALVGEAAHLIPPIGAQGLNLGLRDAATISELVVAARRNRADFGGAELLRRYDAERRADIKSRSIAVDLLNRTLISEFLPLHGVRGLGLYLIDRIGPLRRVVMREGVQPSVSQPRLMRGELL
jgi:2-octaprenyl-6-methoxyphenol hydroxylase